MKLTVTQFVSLDGVSQGPESPGADGSGPYLDRAYIRQVRAAASSPTAAQPVGQRSGSQGGTMLYLVRQLLSTGFLEPAEVRTGESGALEKPYRSTGGPGIWTPPCMTPVRTVRWRRSRPFGKSAERIHRQ